MTELTVEAFDSSLTQPIDVKGEQNFVRHQESLRDMDDGEDGEDVADMEDEYQRKMDEQLIKRMIEKNKQIERLLDELKDVEVVNLELTNQCKKLKLELKTATNELQISCNQMEMLGKQIEELKQLNEDFVKEKQFLVEEIDHLKEKLKALESGDESLTEKYVHNVEQLQRLVQSKEEEIVKLKSSQLIPSQNVREWQKKMKEELEERDKQIELLKTQLNEAVIDIESQTEIIGKLHRQSKSESLTVQLRQEVQSLSNQIKSLEEEVLTKDQELLSLRKRVNTYEKGEYGLRDALKEVNDLTKHLRNRDQRIEEMIQQINSLKLQLNAAEDAIDGLQSYEKPVIAVSDATHLSKRDKTKIREMERRILELEDQKIALAEKLRSSVNKSYAVKQEEYEKKFDLKTRLELVETENRELQTGMKEILNGIRETDALSDVVIECPALERLCTLLESRSIAGDLTNVIALKAELDLIRGHNDQLRADIRQIRSDYMKVIAQYTQDLLDTDLPLQAYDSEDISHDRSSPEAISALVVTDPSTIVKPIDSEPRLAEEEQELSSVVEIDSVLVNRETQTASFKETIDDFGTDCRHFINIFTQTDPINDKTITKNRLSCDNCPKLMKIIDFLKKCVEKLESNIRSSEDKYLQRLQLIQSEQKNLIHDLNEKLSEKDILLNEKEVQISEMQRILTQPQTTSADQSAVEVIRDSPDSAGSPDSSAAVQITISAKSATPLSASCRTVLESVINCLQARLEHKDESIRQYRHMLSEAKQNFENEIIRLIENNRQNSENQIDSRQMIDNEELESALKSCVNELEVCKTQLNARIVELESELEAKSAKLIAYQNENEELRHKRITPSVQYKTIIDQMKEESKQKDSVINTLNKTLRDERSMRAASAPKRQTPRDDQRERKVDNQLFQEIADLRQVIDTQKKSVTDLEVLKWNYEKTIRDIKEENKNKIKQKETEIMALKEKVNKLSVRVNKAENEKMSLQLKVSRREPSSGSPETTNQATQTSGQSAEPSEKENSRLKSQLKKCQKEIKEKESENKALKSDLDMSRQIETELKTLLEESLRREKMSTFEEENKGTDKERDKHWNQLLRENARIKVELRMAEFELKKRFQHFQRSQH